MTGEPVTGAPDPTGVDTIVAPATPAGVGAAEIDRLASSPASAGVIVRSPTDSIGPF